MNTIILLTFDNVHVYFRNSWVSIEVNLFKIYLIFTILVRIYQNYSNQDRESLSSCHETLADRHLLFRSCTGYWNAIKSMVQFAECDEA